MNNFLYIYIDESGNFDFTVRGTKYFILTAVTTLGPFNKRIKFNEIRYSHLCNGIDLDFFHATEDLQIVRDSVFSLIQLDIDDIAIDCVIAQKNKAHPSLYKIPEYRSDGTIIRMINQPDEFYRINCQTLLKYIFRRYNGQTISGVVVILSSLFTEKRSKLITKSLKTYLKLYTPYLFHIYFHSSECDINSQIADYCCWAISIKYERGELRPYHQIHSKIQSEFEIFRIGNSVFY